MTTRRSLLASSGSIAAGMAAARTFAAETPDVGPKIKVGFVGCGGRGGFVADLFREDGGFEAAAAMDYFPDRVQAFGEKFGVPADKRFSGLGGFDRLLESGVDAVAIHSPAWFHPDQCARAIAAGKHVFVAKPVAVDVPGTQSIETTARLATEKNLVMLVDVQCRGNAVFQQALQKVRDGAMGSLTYGECLYEFGTLAAQVAEEKSPEDTLRNWVQHKHLSGDIIVEQNIHSVDIVAWAFGAPVRATGTGGRRVKQGPGDSSDHYNVLFEFKDGGSVAFLSRQYNAWGAPGLAIRNRFFGTTGALETEFGGMVTFRAEAASGHFFRGRTDNLYKEGSVQNVRVFRESIRGGRCTNPTVPEAVLTTRLCLFGRMAAEQKRTVRWEELLADTRRETFDTSALKS